MKQKLLVLGALGSNLGGSYNTGVTTVLNALIPHISKFYKTAIFATNVRFKGLKRRKKWPKKRTIYIYGYSYVNIAILITKDIFFKPIRSFKEILEYRKVYGCPPLRMFIYRVNLSSVLKHFKPDIMHVNGLLLEPVIKNSNYSGIKITTLHGIFSEDQEALEFNRKKGFDLKKLYYESSRLIKALTCLNSENLYQAKTILGIRDVPSAIIHNGIDLKYFYFSKSNRKEVREYFNIPDDEIVFLTVASLTKRKGQLKFMRFMDKAHVPGIYWIIGKGPEYLAIKKETERLKMKNRIKLMGFIPNNQLYKYYSGADILILPSSAEGQAMCILEAAATGIKILINEKIKKTLDLPQKIFKNIRTINLDNFNIPNDFLLWLKSDINRQEKSTTMIPYSWQNIAKKYWKFFESIR